MAHFYQLLPRTTCSTTNTFLTEREAPWGGGAQECPDWAPGPPVIFTIDIAHFASVESFTSSLPPA